MEEQKERIQFINEQLMDLKIQKDKLEKQLRKECILYQKICEKETGHDYITELEEDFHSQKTYYICRFCRKRQ